MTDAVDMHCDTILALLEKEQKGEVPSLYENDLHVDLTKLKKGGVVLQTFALFTDRKLLDIPEQQAMRLYDLYTRMMQENREWIAPVTSFADFEKNRREGKISALLSLEDGGVVFSDLSMLRNWYAMGVRMIALTWNYPNGIGYPNVTFEGGEDYRDPGLMLRRIDTEHGLTEFGIRYVQECERLGIVIDVSHLSDAGFWDVVRYTKAPFVASHSNARGICPAGRNLSDEMIRALAERGGVMGLNFCADFLSPEPGGASRIGDMVRHILYIRDLAGISCIGLGTDFDGIGGEMEIADASFLPKLESALTQSGLNSKEISQIFGENTLNLFRRVLK